MYALNPFLEGSCFVYILIHHFMNENKMFIFYCEHVDRLADNIITPSPLSLFFSFFPLFFSLFSPRFFYYSLFFLCLALVCVRRYGNHEIKGHKASTCPPPLLKNTHHHVITTTTTTTTTRRMRITKKATTTTTLNPPLPHMLTPITLIVTREFCRSLV